MHLRILPPFGDGVATFPVREIQHVAADGSIVPEPTGTVQYLIDNGTEDGCAYAAHHVEVLP